MTGAHLLVVDPVADGPRLISGMSVHGVRTTVTGSTIDALLEFGRNRPSTVIVAPEVTGIAPAEFVEAVRRIANPFVIAVLQTTGSSSDGPPVPPGTSAVIERPYDASSVWKLLQETRHALTDHSRVVFGILELDARAFAVKARGQRLQDLPLKEFELLRALMYRAPDVVSNDDLRLAAWGAGSGAIPDNTLAVHVARLRGRLQGIARIRRVRGHGYALTSE